MNHYIEYYANQAGHRKGSHNIQHGEKFLQKGGGVGGVFSAVFRYLKPYVASGLDVLKEESIRTAADVLVGISNQKPMNEILADRGIEMVDKIRNTAVKKINTMSGGSLKKPLKRARASKIDQSKSISNQDRTSRKKRKKHTKKEEEGEDIFN